MMNKLFNLVLILFCLAQHSLSAVQRYLSLSKLGYVLVLRILFLK